MAGDFRCQTSDRLNGENFARLFWKNNGPEIADFPQLQFYPFHFIRDPPPSPPPHFVSKKHLQAIKLLFKFLSISQQIIIVSVQKGMLELQI